MIMQGLTTTVVGMLVVFCFLALLVIAMSTMSKIVLKYFPEKEVPVKKTNKASNDSEIAAVIAAVTAYTKS